MDYLTREQPGRKRIAIHRALGLVLLLLAVSALVSCRAVDWFLLKRSLRVKFSDVDWITTAQLTAWLHAPDRPPPVLLDVRTPAEWDVSHLPGARRVDPDASAQIAASGLSKSTPIVTYCSVGYRSAQMAERLRRAGYEHVQDLEGSIFQWANEGRPLVREGRPVTQVHPYNATWGRLLRDPVRAPLPK